MATVAVFIFSVFTHLLLLYSTESFFFDEYFADSCPAYFCNDIVGSIFFPFKNITQSRPECGLYTVNCSDRHNPKIRLKDGGYWFQLESISRSNFVVINDSRLQERIERLAGDTCDDDVFKDLSLPGPTPILHTSTNNLTLFRCNNTQEKTPYKYLNYACRSVNYIYYTISNDSLHCSAIQIPILPDSRPNVYNRSALTAKFSLQVRNTKECDHCYHRGGKCFDNKGKLKCAYPQCWDEKGQFNCSLAKKGICHNEEEEGKCVPPQEKCWNEKGQFNCSLAKKGICHDDEEEGKCAKAGKHVAVKLGLGIGLGGAALLGFLAACLFLFRRYKKKIASSNILSRNISSQPYSKSDLEGGNAYFGVSVFTYEELEEATNHFDSEKELGDGGFGTVYYGILKDGREVAVKRLYEHNYKRVEQFMNEIEILTRLRHKNLVSLYGCTSRRSRELILVYEYIPNGTVADHLHGDLAEHGLLTWPIRMSIAIETANALSYLHVSDIVHRDVKTTNILLDNNFCVKVADFGLSRLFPLDVTHVSTAPQGTPGYVDPEYHQCYQLTSKSDVYSFGVVLIELISSLPAVDITRHRHEINLSNIAINKIQRGLYSELVDSCLGFESDHEVKRMTIAVAELAFQCLQQDNDARPTMSEVLETLQIIESGKDVPENLEEDFGDVEMRKSIQPPPSPECDELQLLKNMRPPFSPISVTQNWPSTRSNTPNASC
ncbi:LEAF RUST 10 DISEASE-RESISTANCE LOCUS RECEPTOR-LIKE PROTEIN KINASE-like 1.1 isoform X1 [Rosa chinensis]|uniref:LEAF RUST 10 DISEASE-RESISTANCE LOCUS RECEPTOR-LIKE PROTEIN KINASE-like 1.1 isoform X1 n=1 Tax=Rosa chinensis TaxID=74649 RepID=UPI000D08B115|nr:LEAF RUST 10 DISEASE-RESISTANCE LOCUS RECEPTOR-LIKE PROTEIN KINASE-like 1.1 isoform X1 [Rosa chinensis]